jgi:hypothetical protein
MRGTDTIERVSEDDLIPRNPAWTEEAAYAERMRERAREIAARLSELLPDGMRFEFAADPVPLPKWDACPASQLEDGTHDPAWYDRDGTCPWCGETSKRCEECGVITTMHHDPGCTRPCERCAAELTPAPARDD